MTKKLRVLVACEFSQIVTRAFRDRGHEAYSCDLLPTEGNPDWHIQDDVLSVIEQERFDLMIAHPPCTYLANSGCRWLFEKEGRWEQLADGVEFFTKLLNAPIPRIAIENPTPHKWATEQIGQPYTQRIQPWEFGERQKKGICLWLKNLPPLMATAIEYPPIGEDAKAWESVWREPPGPDQAKNRSRFFPKIAAAMSEQWAYDTNSSPHAGRPLN